MVTAGGDEAGFLRKAMRLLAGLASPRATLVPMGGTYELRSAEARAPIMIVAADLVEEMRRCDWLTDSGDGRLLATSAGRAWLARRRCPDDGFRAQHLDLRSVGLDGLTISLVENESPLAWLRRRKGSDGRAILSAAQFAAGERLRADFTRARMMPRVTSDWTGRAAQRGRRGPSGDPASALDTVIAARQRVDQALDAVGSVLASLLVDVCCFLTGLEDAERSRHWPRRSAKVVLQIGLDRLAEYYGIGEAAHGPARSRRILHWGDENYRPMAGPAE